MSFGNSLQVVYLNVPKRLSDFILLVGMRSILGLNVFIVTDVGAGVVWSRELDLLDWMLRPGLISVQGVVKLGTPSFHLSQPDFLVADLLLYSCQLLPHLLHLLPFLDSVVCHTKLLLAFLLGHGKAVKEPFWVINHYFQELLLLLLRFGLILGEDCVIRVQRASDLDKPVN